MTNSYKRTNLTGSLLRVSEAWFIISMMRECDVRQAGRHGAKKQLRVLQPDPEAAGKA